jgi:hypothetical protein
MKLPEEINGYLLRTFSVPNISCIEYSKRPSFFRYFMENNGESIFDENDLKYEVIAQTIEEAEQLMFNKLDLIRIVKHEFKNCFPQIEYNPCFMNIKSILIKSFTAFLLWDLEKNTKSISILIELNMLKDVDLIIKWIEHLQNLDLSKEIFLADEDLGSDELVFNLVYLYCNEIILDKETLRSKFKSNNIKLRVRDKQYLDKMKPDFFICHDSRDKEVVAKPLFEELRKKGLNVWYDEFSLEIGDSLTEKIQEGIKNCKRAIVIISPNFLSNERWIKYEFQSILSKQISSNSKIILPIWHEVGENDLKDYSFYLLDKLAGNTKNGIVDLAEKLSKLK